MTSTNAFVDPLDLILGKGFQEEQKKVIENACEVCKQATSKYKCPGCLMCTCSMTCCKKHKEMKNCTGIRSKVDYVPLKKYGDKELLCDYYFLEDVGRVLDTAKRTRFQLNMPTTPQTRTSHIRSRGNFKDYTVNHEDSNPRNVR